MKDVYQDFPVFEDNNYMLRALVKEDAADLLKVYSDKAAVPFFNSDNCNGDDFFYDTMERVEQALDFWQFSYDNRYFVRWAVVDKWSNTVIGTIELFHRDAEDAFDNCGLLRLDLRSDFERTPIIADILQLIIKDTYELFYCDKIVTKAIESATERRGALTMLGFSESKEKLREQDNTQYDSYFVRMKYRTYR